MIIHYEIRPEDLIQFNLFHMREDPKTNRAMTIQMIIPIIVIFLMTFFSVRSGKYSLPIAVGFFIVFSVIWIFLYRHLFKRTVEKKMRKILKSDKYKENFGPKTMEFHDNYLLETTQGRKNKLFYKNVYRSIETKEYVYIYEAPGIAYTLPKEFLSEEELTSIKHYLGLDQTTTNK